MFLWLSLVVLGCVTTTLSLTPLPLSNIIHPTSELVLEYLSDYSPADKIIPFIVSIPLTRDMCYLLPLHALQQIPDCRLSSNMHSRKKRFLAQIISIRVGTAAMAMSTANTIQIFKLNQAVNTITQSLQTLESINDAHTAQLITAPSSWSTEIDPSTQLYSTRS